MRLIDYFPELSISVIHSTKDWQEAINFSMASLLAKKLYQRELHSGY